MSIHFLHTLNVNLWFLLIFFKAKLKKLTKKKLTKKKKIKLFHENRDDREDNTEVQLCTHK